jgi:hypothetical protein
MALAEMRLGSLAALSSLSIVVAAAAQEPKRLNGADLFAGINHYVGKQVVLMDGRVFGANNNFALVWAGAVVFDLNVADIDRESRQFLLANCASIGVPDVCRVPLLVVPTGQSNGASPVLKAVRIVR